MFKKTAFIFLMVSVAVFYLTTKGFSQENISVEKKTLLKELLQVTGSHQMARDMMSAMLSRTIPQYKEYLKQMLLYASQRNKNLTEEEKAPIIQKANENIDKIMQRFEKEFVERVDWDNILEEVSFPVYDKYFSEDEIRDLINFYKSPTGSKVVRLMPEVTKEVVPKLSEIGAVKGRQLMDEICNDVLGPAPQAQQSTQPPQ